MTPPGSILDVEFAQVSDSGRAREHNEDYLGCLPAATPEMARSHGWLFALADGVGGQEGGEVASKAAVESLLGGFREAPAGEPPAVLLARLVQAANTRVYELGCGSGPGGVAMATTIVACILRFDRAVVAHAGDSRCYLIRRDHAALLTRDHTVANEQIGMGVLSSREAARAETRHVLSRALGSDLFVSVETGEHQIFSGDVLALCSDGLHGSVSASDMVHAVRSHARLDDAAHALVALANQRDGSDNISVQLVRARSVERVGMYRGRPYRLP